MTSNCILPSKISHLKTNKSNRKTQKLTSKMINRSDPSKHLRELKARRTKRLDEAFQHISFRYPMKSLNHSPHQESCKLIDQV